MESELKSILNWSQHWTKANTELKSILNGTELKSILNGTELSSKLNWAQNWIELNPILNWSQYWIEVNIERNWIKLNTESSWSGFSWTEPYWNEFKSILNWSYLKSILNWVKLITGLIWTDFNGFEVKHTKKYVRYWIELNTSGLKLDIIVELVIFDLKVRLYYWLNWTGLIWIECAGALHHTFREHTFNSTSSIIGSPSINSHIFSFNNQNSAGSNIGYSTIIAKTTQIRY